MGSHKTVFCAFYAYMWHSVFINYALEVSGDKKKNKTHEYAWTDRQKAESVAYSTQRHNKVNRHSDGSDFYKNKLLFIIILLFKIKVDATHFNTTTTNSIFNGIISAAWKIIKTWLPAGAVKKIKFLSKANVGEYVEEDQRPAQWGGKKMFIN